MALTRPSAAQLSSASIDFTDPLLRINKDQSGANNKDIGLVFERGSDTNVGLIWDESNDEFALINTTETGTTSGNVTIGSYANLTIGSLTSAGLSYPSSDGTSGQVLQTDGSGTLSFTSITASPAGSNTQVQYNNNGSLGASANLTFDGTSLTSTGFSGPLTGNVTGNADTASAWANARTITLGGVLSGNVSIDGSSNVTLTAAHTSDPTITLTGAVTGSATMTNLGNVSISTTATSDPTLTLAGDATGSATFTNLGNATLTVTIADDSHNHIIGNVDGLQTALDAKLDLSGGTMSGNLTFGSGSDIVFGSGSQINVGISGEDNYVFAFAPSTNYGLTFNSAAGNPAGGSYDFKDGTGAAIFVVPANTGNSAEFKYDGNIIWTAGNDGSGSGLDADTLDGQQGSYYLDWTNVTNKPDPTITLTGDVTGSGTMTNLGNVSITATVADDSHNHIISNIDGLQTALDGKLSTSGKAADSNLLDGYDRLELVPYQSTNDFANGTLVTTNIDASVSSGDSFVIEITAKAYGSSVPHVVIAEGYIYNNTIINTNGVNITGSNFTYLKVMNNNGWLSVWWPRHGYWNSYSVIVRSSSGGTSSQNRVTSIVNSVDPAGATKKIQIDLARSWTSVNDGEGSGLDADTTDGYHVSTTRNAANTIPVRDANGYLQLGWINTTSGATTSSINKIYASSDDYIRYVTPATLISQLGLWTSGNDGTGSGLDADTLDGVQGSSFLRSNAADIFTGEITAQNSLRIDQNGNSGNIVYETSGGCYVPRPLGGSYKTTASVFTGSIAVKLPTQSWAQSDMISFWVDIFDYAGNPEGESVSLHIYGYQYSTGNWTNVGALVLSDRTDRDYTVRFGHDGTRHIVYIGETSSTWNYPQVNVRDFQAGYNASYANYDDAFAVTFETTHSNIQQTASNNYSVSKHANNIQVDADNSTNATHYLLFTGGASGSQRANSDTGLTYNPSSNTLTTTNFSGRASTASYADLAENYTADQSYPVGTVLDIGGVAEVTIATKDSYKIAGTVSEKPGYLMNSELSGNHVTPVAYIGRVPCRVIGKICRGDILVVGDTPGVAVARHPKDILPGQAVGKALESYDTDQEGIIEIMVGRL